MYKDDHEKDPKRRYKGSGSWILVDGKMEAGILKRDNGVGLFFSPDGIHESALTGIRSFIPPAMKTLSLSAGMTEFKNTSAIFGPRWTQTRKSYARLSPPAGKTPPADDRVL